VAWGRRTGDRQSASAASSYSAGHKRSDIVRGLKGRRSVLVGRQAVQYQRAFDRDSNAQSAMAARCHVSSGRGTLGIRLSCAAPGQRASASSRLGVGPGRSDKLPPRIAVGNLKAQQQAVSVDGPRGLRYLSSSPRKVPELIFPSIGCSGGCRGQTRTTSRAAPRNRYRRMQLAPEVVRHDGIDTRAASHGFARLERPQFIAKLAFE